MKKYFLLLSISFLSVLVVTAQKNELWVKKNEKGLYIDHKVVPKESFYSVGRLYNVSPKALADFNNLDMKKGLFIDQKIKIPLSKENFDQQGNSGTPVYYKVGDNEGLMTVSNENNNVALSKLRDWNDLTDDKPEAGKKLIIGFVHSKSLPSITIKVKTKAKEEPVVIKKEEKPVEKIAVIAEKEKEKTVEEVAQKKEEPKETGPEKKKEEVKTVPVVDVKEQKPVLTEQGYFKLSFEQQSKVIPPSRNETVTSGIFKTVSGWQDAKYYMLMDAISPGTIVKVINPGNDKAIYAKVLGQMSGIRQNEGYNIRISNAAADALNVTDPDKFIVKINY